MMRTTDLYNWRSFGYYNNYQGRDVKKLKKIAIQQQFIDEVTCFLHADKKWDLNIDSRTKGNFRFHAYPYDLGEISSLVRQWQKGYPSDIRFKKLPASVLQPKNPVYPLFADIKVYSKDLC